MADFNSKYTGEQVEQLLDQVASGNAGGGGGITEETDPIFSASPAATITEEKIAEWNGKQDAISDLAAIREGAALGATALQEHQDISNKQDKLVSGTNIKTINGTSLLGSGDIAISGGGSGQSAFKRGIVEQTQTWTKAADGGYDYTMSNLVEGDIPIANIDLFAASGVVFNEETGYFELNGLVDISYKEMLAINSLDILYNYTNGDMNIYTTGRIARTLYPSVRVKNVTQSFVRSARYLETLVINVGSYCTMNGTSYTFYNGIDRLKSVLPEIRAADTITFPNTFFHHAYSLEEVRIKSVSNNIGFPEAARLSVKTVLFMINKSSATRAFTITLHPTAYARAIADASVQAALEAHTNVTLASA